MNTAIHSGAAAPSAAAGMSAASRDSSASAPASPGAAADFSRLGMTLRHLGRVVDEQPGGRRALAGLTTAQVKDLLFLPLTSASQLSLCQQMHAEGGSGVGVATWFVSHAWMCVFVELLEALEHFFASEPLGLDTVIWLDLVSTSQHGTFSRPPEWWRQTFMLAIQSLGNMVMVMCPWDRPVTLTRAWCVLELYACCSSGCRFEIALPQTQRAQLTRDLMYKNDAFFDFLANVRSESSECSRSTDRASIFAAVRASVGFAGLDALVRRTLEVWMLRLLGGKIDEARAAGNEVDVMNWLNALGSLNLDLGMNSEALCLFEEAVKIGMRVLGTGDQTFLVLMSNTANAYMRNGQHARALALNKEVMASERLVRGMEHAHTLKTMSNIAAGYIETNDLALGVPLMEEALSIQQRVLGDDHEDTLNSMLALALTCYTQGDYAGAEVKFDQVEPIMQRALGAQHPKTLNASLFRVLLLLRTARVDEAQHLAAATCEAFASVLGPSHPITMQSAFVAALTLFYGGQIDAPALSTAWLEHRDQMGSVVNKDLQREYEVALGSRA